MPAGIAAGLNPKPPPAFPRQGRTEKNRRNKKTNSRLFFYGRAQPSPLSGPPSICSPGSQEALFFLAPAASQARGRRQTHGVPPKAAKQTLPYGLLHNHFRGREKTHD
jgi:hypothetical protein